MCGTRIPRTPRSLPASSYYFNGNIPESVDWRRYAQPIAHQGGCGACWAFSATSVVEFFNVIKGNWNYTISKQNLIDCDNEDFGCDGGWPMTALDFLKDSFGNKLAKEVDYPFLGVKASCRKVKSYTKLNIGKTFQIQIKGNDTALKSVIANHGPVAAAMLVPDSGLFQLYESGIFSDPSCPDATIDTNDCFNVNHGVVIVGYGKDSTTNEQYWIVRNSWGSNWGESGYFRLAMVKNACNIACYAIGVE
ncbi:procathepsin L-like [Chironomus tepperi]|uniref:procathepsin L-like n=1 Tax=Chironomus tepperi TaxID=113505 RepID=UPI00391FA7CB